MKIVAPPAGEYDRAFAGYVAQVTEADIFPLLESQLSDLASRAKSITADQETYRYAEGKWSVREVLGHLVDGERVFGYRAFCISRGDQTNLPSFEENDYVATSVYHEQPVARLVEEFIAVRRTNLLFLSRLDEKGWLRIGKANSRPISVRALAYIMVGHPRHHFNVLHERYSLWP
jgi:hypothetical protein